jgi:hypothetical protein
LACDWSKAGGNCSPNLKWEENQLTFFSKAFEFKVSTLSR